MSVERRRLWNVLATIFAIAVGVVVFRAWRGNPEPAHPDRTADVIEPARQRPAEPPPNRFLNAAADVAFVGNDTCAECHRDQHATYHLSGHATAMREPDPAREPPDAEYFHEVSGRRYRVYRDRDELRHRESIRDDVGDELILNDEPVRYVIGSGSFSQSYLIAKGDFLVESPVTWYSARQRWEMSPGFDEPYHAGFERLADQGCVICHAGQVALRDGNAFQPIVQMTSIGCESCHGPGALHVEARRRKTPIEEDLTIVNPAKLSRELAESVCANCHLRGEATIYRQGRSLDDFRPGHRLTDLRIDFRVKSDQPEMTVVGHVDQMRLSRCYIESESLTCIICHSPHTPPPAPDDGAARVEFFKQSCLACHAESACGVPHAERLAANAADNCVACHMPTTDTDIPHFAFTHHRIGIHRTLPDETDSPKSRPRTLVPLADPDEFTADELDRALGLAYFEFAAKEGPFAATALERAERHLLQGTLDGEAAAALAVLQFQRGLSEAHMRAEQALADRRLSSRSRVNALVVRGVSQLRQGDAASAVSDFEELTRLRRVAEYFSLLSEALRQTSRFDESRTALEQAVAIAPQRLDLRQRLAEAYRESGQDEQLAEQERAIRLLAAHQRGVVERAQPQK